jgi:hypothetical protein
MADPQRIGVDRLGPGPPNGVPGAVLFVAAAPEVLIGERPTVRDP